MRLLLIAGVLCIVFAAGTMASTPHLISYQGRLTDSGGNPAADSTYSVIFRIYDDPIGGIALWSETRNVTTSDGLFHVQLGAVSPIDPAAVLADSARYLSTQVGGDPELMPRIRFTSVPHAFRTASVDGAAGGEISGKVSVIDSTLLGDAVGYFRGRTQGVFAAAIDNSVYDVTAIEGQASNSSVSGRASGVHGLAFGAGENRAVHGFAYNGNLNYGLVGEALGGTEAYGIKLIANSASYKNVGVSTGTNGGQVSMALDAQSAGGTFSNVGVNADASGSGTYKYGLIAQAHGAGDNYGIYGSAYGGTTNFAGYFEKGPSGANPAANSIVVMEANGNGYLSILTPDANEKGVLFGQTANEAAGGVIYNASSVPAGLSFRVFNNTTRMVLTSGGRLGTNILTPEAGLHIRGTGFPSSFGYFDTYGISQDAGLRFYEAGVAKSHLYHNASTKTLDLFGVGFAGISIDEVGAVGIGTFTPNYTLDVRGTIGSNAALYHSDLRWKENVETLSNSSGRLQQLRGVSFNWKREEFADMNFPEGVQIGLVAQEVEGVIPEVVSTGADGYKSVDYSKLVALLIEAIKEQQIQIDELKATVEEMIAVQSDLGNEYGQK